MGDLHPDENRQVGERTMMVSSFMNGVMKMPGTWTPEKKPGS